MRLIIFFICFLAVLFIMLPEEVFFRKGLLRVIFRDEEKASMHMERTENGLLDIIIRIARRISRYIPRKAIPGNLDNAKRNLVHAGLSNKISVEDFIGIKYTAVLFCTLYFLMLLAVNPSITMLLCTIAISFMSYCVPDNCLKGKVRRRQALIEKDVPSLLSSLAITTDAGLNLIQAIEEVTARNEGELAAELKKTLEDVRLGISNKEAFEKLSERCNVEEVNYFVSALVQSLEKGNSGITLLLRELAKESWEKRKEKAKALAEKASIKLFMPLLLLVFPAFAIFLLGPMAFSIYQTLFK